MKINKLQYYNLTLILKPPSVPEMKYLLLYFNILVVLILNIRNSEI